MRIVFNQKGAMDKLIVSLSIVIIGTCAILVSYVLNNNSTSTKKIDTIADIEAYMNKNVPASSGEVHIETIVGDKKSLNITTDN